MRKLLIAGLGLGAAVSLQPLLSSTASAIELGLDKPATSAATTQVQYRRCVAVRRECRVRWRGGWRYRRCVTRRGCV